MRLQDRNMIGGAGVSLQKKWCIWYSISVCEGSYKVLQIQIHRPSYKVLNFLIWAYSKVLLLR